MADLRRDGIQRYITTTEFKVLPLTVTGGTGVNAAGVSVFRRPGSAFVNVNLTATSALSAGFRLFYMPAECWPPITVFGDVVDTTGDVNVRLYVTATGDALVETAVAAGHILRGQFEVPF